MKLTNQKIHITQTDNDNFFDQKLSTFRDDFCIIERTVFDIQDDEENPGLKIGYIRSKHSSNGLVRLEDFPGTGYEWEVACFQA